MTKKIFFFLLLMSTTIANATDVIYLIRGNWRDVHSPIHRPAEVIFENFVKSEYPKVYFQNFHNHKWKSHANMLVKLHQMKKLNKVILVGHSWGASVSHSIADYLYKQTGKQIDLFISLDPIQKPFQPAVTKVSKAIKRAFNYRQVDDKRLTGRGPLIWMDPTNHTLLPDVIWPFKGQQWPHDQVLFKAMNDKVVPNHIRDILNKP